MPYCDSGGTFDSHSPCVVTVIPTDLVRGVARDEPFYEEEKKSTAFSMLALDRSDRQFREHKR
jgi:hypothetical protein